MLAGPYLGTVAQDEPLFAALLMETASGLPTDPDAPPTYRIYGSTGLMPNSTGNLTKLDTTAITAATDATPIQITAANHGYNTGTRVAVSGVLGNTSANTTATVSVVDANNFTLDGSAGNGAYASGGTAHVAGLYQINLTVASGNGFVAGQTYQILVEWTIAGVNYGMMCSFTVI